MMNGIPTFVKWAGGKKQLIEQFKPFFPKEINRYFEPFVGGGAVAFYIIKHYKPKMVFISDSNKELINTYLVIRNDVEKLISKLKEYKKKHSKKFYYKIRAENPKGLSSLERAVRLIYLNKTCFNGLYKVNSKGEFNVPMGNYNNPAIVNEKDLREVSKLLKNTKISAQQFNKIESKVRKNDFVYFDPPYYPLKKKSFTTYTKERFLDKEQKELARLFKALDKKGAKVMLSNSDSAFIRELYRDYKIDEVEANRAINSDAEGRGKINEIIVTNYKIGKQAKL